MEPDALYDAIHFANAVNHVDCPLCKREKGKQCKTASGKVKFPPHSARTEQAPFSVPLTLL